MSTEDNRNILLVEDEAIIAMMQKAELEKYGYNVHQAATGEKAVRIIIEEYLPVDLILMDIDLGSGIDGTQAAEQILNHKDIPIVFLSSHTEPETVEKTERITSYGYVVKYSGIVVLDASIKMAFRLFEEKKRVDQSRKLLAQTNRRLLDSENELLIKERLLSNKLDLLLAPETGAAHLNLNEIIDINEIQSILNNFFELTGMVTALLDLNGNVLVATGWQDICTKFHRVNRGTSAFCTESDLYLAKNLKPGEFVDYKCKNGLWDVVTPLYVGEKHVGNIFTGQFFYENDEIDTEYFVKQADTYGFDTEKYIDALNKVPRYKKAAIKELMEFLVKFFKLVSRLSHSNILLARESRDRQISHRKLQQEENNLRITLNSIGDAVLSTDDQGRVVRMNPVAEELCGWALAEAKGRPLSEVFNIVNYETRRKVPDPVEKVLLSGTVIGLANHTVLISKNGSEYQITDSAAPIKDEYGRINGVVLVFSDVTEKYLVEERSKENETKFKSYIQNAQDGIFIADEKGTYIEINNSVCKITGYSEDELLDLRISDLIQEEYFEKAENHLKTVFRDGFAGAELGFITKSGRRIVLNIDAVKLSDKRFLGFARDITESKRAEAEIQKQLEEKETLLREVHHRIKNNMNNVESLLSMQAEATDNPEARAAIESSLTRVKSIRVLYDKLLLGNDYNDISIRTYVYGLLDAFFSVYAMGKEVSIDKQISDFTIDSKKAVSLGIIINELLTNAFRYAFLGRNGGVVSIFIGNTDDRATLIIQDNGIGIEEQRILNESTGMGHTLVKILAEQLGGTFSIENKNGTRCTVQFEI